MRPVTRLLEAAVRAVPLPSPLMARPPRNAVVLAEPLESRRLFAAIEAGVLVARGMGGDDTISLRRTGTDDVVVTTNGVNQTFDMDNFTSVRLEGLAGNDRFNLIDDLTSPVVRPVTVLGGDGADRMVLSNFANATFDGGANTDTVDVAASLLDTINMAPYANVENLTGAGNHVRTVFGNFIGNRIEANGGANGVTLNGLGGHDTLIGGAGVDSLNGGDGNDSLAGNGGDDTLVGEAGDDTLNGGAGDDFGDGGPGTNTHVSIERFPGSQPSIVIEDRILIATGTINLDALETLTIRRTGTDDVTVTANSLSRTFDMDDFDGVLLRGIGGNDEIFVLDPITAGSLTRKVTVEGGAGDDSLHGGGGDDVLRGGDDNDSITGGQGSDALFGDAGDDYLSGGIRLDFMDGGEGNDHLDADDNLLDDAGDTVLGGNGIDSAEAEPGDQVSGVESVS